MVFLERLSGSSWAALYALAFPMRASCPSSPREAGPCARWGAGSPQTWPKAADSRPAGTTETLTEQVALPSLELEGIAGELQSGPNE